MGPRQMAGFRVPRRAVRTGLGELGSPRRAATVAGRHQALGAMEPPAHPADPADAADPGDSAEARAKQPGKGRWALVRSLNQALKTYAVLPVSPGPEGGDAPFRSQAGRRVAKPQGAHRLRSSDAPVPKVHLARSLPLRAGSFCSWETGGAQKGIPCLCPGPEQGAPPGALRGLGGRLWVRRPANKRKVWPARPLLL